MGYGTYIAIFIVLILVIILLIVINVDKRTEDSLSQTLNSLLVRKEDIAQISYLIHTWIAERVGNQESSKTTYDNIKLRVKLYANTIMLDSDSVTTDHYTELYMTRITILSDFINAILNNQCIVNNKSYRRKSRSDDMLGSNIEILNDGVFGSDDLNLIMEKDITCFTDETRSIIEKMKTNCEEITCLFLHKKNYKNIESSLESEARILFSQAYFYVQGNYKSSMAMMSKHLVESREFIKYIIN